MHTHALLLPFLVASVGFLCVGCPEDGGLGDGGVTEDSGIEDSGAEDSGPTDSGATDSGTGDSGIGTGGCAFTSIEYDAGWSGSPGPACSATTISAGDPLTCSVGAFGFADVTMVLVDSVNFNSAGSGFVEPDGDGLVEIEIDTQFAVPGVYALFMDGAPDLDNLQNYVSIGPDPDDSGNYAWVDVIDNVFPDDVNPLDCVRVLVTVE